MIDLYVSDIRNSLKNQSYYSALSLALTLPDVCGMAEYPNKQVAERYIGWDDKYIGELVKNSERFEQSPYLSGEIVYNLRNTYLHQGSPKVAASKIKEEANQVDKFILLLGDGTKIQEVTIAVCIDSVAFRAILVDITYLCNVLCDCALDYYRSNISKFKFECNVIPEQYLYGKDSPFDYMPKDADPLGKIITKKLLTTGKNVQIAGNLTQSILDISARAISGSWESQSIQQKLANHSEPANEKLRKIQRKPSQKVGSSTKSKKELQMRSFFGENFKEKKYKDKKEQLINAFMTSKTKTQLNSKLMQIFPGSDVKIILERLQPKIKDWPGQ